MLCWKCKTGDGAPYLMAMCVSCEETHRRQKKGAFSVAKMEDVSQGRSIEFVGTRSHEDDVVTRMAKNRRGRTLAGIGIRWWEEEFS